ncbi:MAG: DUF4377 domain-containing protein [Odoribacter sp.]|nr:DUF4377 domain-containing protein [Odoribacter sp.]
MKTRFFGGALVLLFCIFSFISCSNDDEEGRKVTDYKELVLTVASKKIPGIIMEGNSVVSELYAVKKEQTDEWIAYGSIAGFEYEKGYEYKIKVSETTYLDYAMGAPAWTERDLLEVISKVQKDSEGLPLHFIPDAYYKRIPLPEYRYAVEAENKSPIEEDLKANSLLPTKYHYMLCHSGEGYLKWMGLQDANHFFGPYIVKSTSKKPEEMPESYKLLPPDGRMIGGGEWMLLDESGNATDYPPFDVFIGYYSKTRSVLPAYDMLCFYKDLTRHYQNKYPDAGVKTVVVSYAFKDFY